MSLVNETNWNIGELVAKTLRHINEQWSKWVAKNKSGGVGTGSNASTIDLDSGSDVDSVDEDKVCKSLLLACVELVTAFYTLRNEGGWDL